MVKNGRRGICGVLRISSDTNVSQRMQLAIIAYEHGHGEIPNRVLGSVRIRKLLTGLAGTYCTECPEFHNLRGDIGRVFQMLLESMLRLLFGCCRRRGTVGFILTYKESTKGEKRCWRRRIAGLGESMPQKSWGLKSQLRLPHPSGLLEVIWFAVSNLPLIDWPNRLPVSPYRETGKMDSEQPICNGRTRDP